MTKVGDYVASLDEIFYREFRLMMQQRREQTGAFGLSEIALPPEFSGEGRIAKHSMLAIRGIKEEYYSKLNNTEVRLLPRCSLSRRKVGFDGKYQLDASGAVKREDVPVPRGSVAVVSSERIGVPYKFKSKEGFDYVDMAARNNVIKYMYIVPRKYCYKLNQVALVLSFTRPRAFYEGVCLALQNGQQVFLYTIPYTPSTAVRPYRIICTKTSCNFKSEVASIMKWWVGRGILFPFKDCELAVPVKGVTNMGYSTLNGTLSDYVRLDPNKSLGGTESTDALFD